MTATIEARCGGQPLADNDARQYSLLGKRSKSEHRLAVAIVVAMSGGFAGMLNDSLLMRRATPFIFYFLYGASLHCLLSQRQPDQRRARPDLALIAFGLVAVSSLVWSVDRRLTFSHLIHLGGTGVCGLFMVERLSAHEIIKCIRQAASILALCSLAYFLVNRGAAADPTHHTLRGVFDHRNILGAMMGLGIIAGVLEFASGTARRSRVAVCLASSAVALFLSGARTPIVGVTLGLTGGLFWLALKRAGRPLPALSAALFGAAILVALYGAGGGSKVFLEPLSRDSSLTGRTLLWSQVGTAIDEQPNTGYGLGAFWEGPAPAAQRIVSHTWATSHAHSALLDAWLDVGALGPVLLIASFVLTLLAALQSRISALSTAMRISFAVGLASMSIGESYLLWPHSIFMLLWIIMSARRPAPSSRYKTDPSPPAVAITRSS